jgi:signal recognition particle receptor subunit beta
MALVNLKTREIQIKIVYSGPAASGKTASLAFVHRTYRKLIKSQFLAISSHDDRTVFFDFLSFKLPRVAGFEIQVHLYTVPGHEHYEETRRTLMKGVDGIVFVADLAAMRKSNVMALKSLQSQVSAHGKDLARLPLVFQFNKHDLADRGATVLSHETLLNDLNSQLRRPYYLASAASGKNVVAVFKRIIIMTVDAVQKRLHEVD